MFKATSSERDHAILMMLLDTGIRATELCTLKIADVDLRTGKLSIQGKGGKERICYLGNVARRSLWKYADSRDPSGPLFVTKQGRSLNAHRLWKIVVQIGKRANVANARPHRFRQMVKHYARLAAIDAEQAHRRASPADHWLR